MEKVIKSIRLLLFFALIQLALCSCIFWSGTSLALKQSCFYFLLALLGLSGSCAFMHYLSSHNQATNSIIDCNRFIFLLYSMMVIVNLCGVGLVRDYRHCQLTSKRSRRPHPALLLFSIWSRPCYLSPFEKMEKITKKFQQQGSTFFHSSYFHSNIPT